MTLPLSNKIAIVTGASRGIGAACARRLANAGATVAITYSSSLEQAEEVVRSIESDGGRARAFQSDATDVAAAARLVADVVAAFGRLDILVNNAGAFVGGAIAESTLDTYDGNFDTNVRGVHELMRAAAPQLSDGGRVITVGSGYGTRPPAGAGAYAASKAAVEALGKAWAKELAPRRITVNTVSPGSVDTTMNPADASVNPSADAQRDATPLGHFGTPDDIAVAVAFLAGPDAGFITGANLPVDGGYTA